MMKQIYFAAGSIFETAMDFKKWPDTLRKIGVILFPLTWIFIVLAYVLWFAFMCIFMSLTFIYTMFYSMWYGIELSDYVPEVFYQIEEHKKSLRK